MKVSFIGFGRMGSALAQGAVRAGVLKASQIFVFDNDAQARSSARRLGAKLAASVSEAAGANVVFLCVKPQQMGVVLTEIGSGARGCFVSIAAGVTIARIRKELGSKCAIFRVMPNTPALLGAGMSAVSRGPGASRSQEKFITALLSSVGAVVSLPEKAMDAVTAVSGSGPAYAFYLAEAMMEAARREGLSPAVARTLVHQTIFGAGLMLSRRSEPADELRRQVTSPGGTTAAAIAVFDRKNLKSIVKDALRSAARRSKELSKI